MKTIWNDYPTRAAAEDAVKQVISIGVPHEDVTIIGPMLAAQQVAADPGNAASTGKGAAGRQGSFADTAPVFHDRRVERQGTFADAEPVFYDRNTERQGSFADEEPVFHDSHTERHGSFADMEPARHESHTEQHGSFASVDLGAGDDATVTRVLAGAGIAENERGIAAASLHQGHMLVVVHAPSDVAEQVDHIIH